MKKIELSCFEFVNFHYKSIVLTMGIERNSKCSHYLSITVSTGSILEKIRTPILWVLNNVFVVAAVHTPYLKLILIHN